MRRRVHRGFVEARPSDYVIPAPLDAEELRVLGCLFEKQFLTPDIYPLTVNALISACNQKTSREPVVNYDEQTIHDTLGRLQQRGLATRISGPEHRVPKYRELVTARANLRLQEIGVLCVMMLRGPQTLAELKERTNRIYEFSEIGDVEATLERMMHREPQILVTKLPKQTGYKEIRYAHLLGGEVTSMPEPAHSQPLTTPMRMALEERVAALEDEVARLKEEFANFRKQFE